MLSHEELLRELVALSDEFIGRCLGAGIGIREGVVMTLGPPPYRRLDCDGRALAYVRCRPRKHAVRIDISGLWPALRPSRIRISSASGSATLLVRTPHDVGEAIAYLHDIVLALRQAELRRLGGGFDPRAGLAQREAGSPLGDFHALDGLDG